MPLVADRLPANVNYVLVKFLNLVRLNVSGFNQTMDDTDSLQYENQLAADDESLFTSRMLQSGYRFSIARNLLFGLCIALMATFIWAVIILAEKYYKPHKNVRKSKSKEVFMSNLMTRFFIEAFFELMICSFINMS